MKLQLLEDVYVNEIAALLDAEMQFLKAAPSMAQSFLGGELGDALAAHMELTGEHVRRLEEIVSRRGGQMEKRSQATRGLLADIQELTKPSSADETLLEMGLITGAKKIEALEIAWYSAALDLARQLRFGEDAKLLERTLREECDMADKLTALGAGMMLEAAEAEDALANR